MAKKNDNKQIEAQLTELIKASENSQTTGYDMLARRKDKKAARHNAVKARLAKTLEAEDPKLKMAKIKAGKAAETAAAFKQRVTRLKKKPKLGENDWMVSGNVRYDSGRAAGGLTVQVYDKDLKFDDLLGTAVTDDFGDFHVVYDTCRFDDEWGNDRPDLYLRILDKDGNVLADHTEPLRVDAGRVEYFEVVIPTKPAAKRSAKKKKGRSK
ncbi:MAG: hypothetical protein QNJ45_17980 [Ardenticatenaceae bacterium]|nr:hypothetical protein [Ardenticatenaceae bacterium]